jgi:ribonucleoside-diphosphate reductase alpha chain
MMAAVQPFISGAISKTINLPNEATVENIKECYELSWKLGIKANALYRDGCKLSQPLSNKSDKKKSKENKIEKVDAVEKVLGNKGNLTLSELTPDQVLEAARDLILHSKDTKFKRQLSAIVERKKLPGKRYGFTQKTKIGGQAIFIRTGEYGDGTLGEIFIDMHREGASFRSLLNCFAIAISIGLQYGVPLEEYVNKFTFTRFEPSGPVDHPNIKHCTSVIDYMFRLLGFEYLGRQDLVQVKPTAVDEKPSRNEAIIKNSAAPVPVKAPGTNGENAIKKAALNEETTSKLMQEQYLGGMMGDAPACSVCGHITIRSGTCYKCLNCGNSMGCS